MLNLHQSNNTYDTRHLRWRWTAATLIGGGAAMLLGWVLLHFPSSFGSIKGLAGLAALFAPGYLLGWAQTYALPYPMQPSNRWGVATLAGYLAGICMLSVVGLGALTFDLSFGIVVEDTSIVQGLDAALLNGAVFGVLLGMMQAIVLRDYTPRAWWWAAASGVGALIGGGVGGYVFAVTAMLLPAWLAALVPYALVTGVILPWIVAERG